MKKFGWYSCLFFCCLILFFTTFASADTSGFSYSQLKDGGIMITGYSGWEADVIVPATIDGYEVKSIGMYAFDRALPSTITLPEGLTTISSNAFASRRFLEEIVLPNSIEAIGTSAFAKCQNLKNIIISPDHPRFAFKEGALYDKLENTLLFFAPGYTQDSYAVIPEGIKHIADSAFENCTQLTSITVPEGVLSIGAQAFANCTSLNNINLPESLLSIGHQAFANCPLESISLPAQLESIGDKAFSACNFSTISIPESTSSIGENPFLNCSKLTKIIVSSNNSRFAADDYGALFSKNQNELICYPQASEQEVYVLPKEISSIAPYAFAYCENLKQVELSESLAYIHDAAFLNCINLQSISFPFKMQSIGDYAFSGCTNLKTLLFLSGDTQIANTAFEYYNIARIYATPSSQALNYASRYSIPFTPFVEGSIWKCTSSADEFHFMSDGIVRMPNGKSSYTEGKYWVDDTSGEVGFYLNQRYRADSIRFDGNKIRTGSGYQYKCISATQPDIFFETYPLYNQPSSLAGTRWISRTNSDMQIPLIIQFIDDTTYELLHLDNTLIRRDTYNTVDEQEISWPALTQGNMRALLKESSLIIVEKGKVFNNSFNYVDAYDYAGEIQAAIVPTATPEPTPEPTATPAASKPTLTKDYVVGSWNNGSLILNADGSAVHKGTKGRFRIKSGMVIFTYYHAGHDEDQYVYFYWENDGTLSDYPYVYQKDQ